MKFKPFQLIACVIISIISLAPAAFSQTKLPDGSVVYKDGSRRLPDGTLQYPKGVNRNRAVYTHKDRTRYTTYRRNHLPPGQAKKIYGGEARDYAPGHNKGNANWKKDNDRDNDRGNEKHEGNGHGKGRKD
jgi:hypothetical protein